MKFKFIYTIENEVEEVVSILESADWLIENRYSVILPGSMTLEQFNINTVRQSVEREFYLHKPAYDSLTKGLLEDLVSKAPTLESYFAKHGFQVPKDVEVFFTAYGTQGGYDLPNKVMIRINPAGRNVADVIVHEVAHLIVEELVVLKRKLSQNDKENFLDWLLTETELKNIVPNYVLQDNYQMPSEELRNIFLTHR